MQTYLSELLYSKNRIAQYSCCKTNLQNIFVHVIDLNKRALTLNHYYYYKSKKKKKKKRKEKTVYKPKNISCRTHEPGGVDNVA